MGNETSGTGGKGYRINHDILENSEISAAKNIMKTHISGCKEPEMEKWVKAVECIQQSDRQYLFIPNSLKLKELSLFGSHCALTLVFDCYPYLLIDEINNRKNLTATFQQPQIWYLLWALIDASILLSQNHMKLGDIRPHNILFNETGDVKFICGLSWPNQVTNYTKTRYLKSITFLSPEQLCMMTTGDEFDGTCSQMSQAFSIGLTLLSLMLVLDMSCLYEADQMYYGINFKKLQYFLSRLPNLTYLESDFKNRKDYSEGLKHVVRKLCESNLQNRLSINQLWLWLKPFKQDIIEFKPFDFSKHLDELAKKSNFQSPLKQFPNPVPNKQPFAINQPGSNNSGQFHPYQPFQGRQNPSSAREYIRGATQSRAYPYHQASPSHHQFQYSHGHSPLSVPPNQQPKINAGYIVNKLIGDQQKPHLMHSPHSPGTNQNKQQKIPSGSQLPIKYPLGDIDHRFHSHLQTNINSRLPYPVFNQYQHAVPSVNMPYKIVNYLVPPEQSYPHAQVFKVRSLNEGFVFHESSPQIVLGNKNMIPPQRILQNSIQKKPQRMEISQSGNQWEPQKGGQGHQNRGIREQLRAKQAESVYIREEKKKFVEDAEKLLLKIDQQISKSKNLFPNQ